MKKCFYLMMALISATPASMADQLSRVEENGTIHVQAFDLPMSGFLSRQTRIALKHQREKTAQEWKTIIQSCPSFEGAKVEDIPAIRQCRADAFYKTRLYQSLRNRYPVQVTGKTMGGVYTEVFTPANGIVSENDNLVLINLHGGGFLHGARTISHLESIPIASLGGIKVISVDYRQAPEHQFPAASEDVAAVYQALLKTYRPENIGIYGCSAGAELTTQVIAWFQYNKLPMPGAVALLCSASPTLPEEESRSDSAYIGGAIFDKDYEALYGHSHPYYQGVNRSDPLVSPMKSDEIMVKFPSTLLVSSTRDFMLSTVVVTHRQLVRLGVKTELHIWEGLAHGFHLNPTLPESQEVHNLLLKFFKRHLVPKELE